MSEEGISLALGAFLSALELVKILSFCSGLVGMQNLACSFSRFRGKRP